MNYNYVRFLEVGVLVALCDRICGTWNGTNIVLDRIATSTDIKRLPCNEKRRRRRTKLINKTFDCVKELSLPNYSKLSCFFALVEGLQDVRHLSFGSTFAGPEHVDICKSMATNPQVDQDHMSLLVKSLANAEKSHWKLEKQIRLLNFLPNQNMNFAARQSRKHTLAEGIFRSSCKSLLIQGKSDLNAIYSACITATFQSPQRITLHDFDDDIDDTQWQESLQHNVIEPSATTADHGTRTPLNMTAVEKYKSLLQRTGFIRVRKNSDTSYDIIWNKYEVVKGFYLFVIVICCHTIKLIYALLYILMCKFIHAYGHICIQI